MGILTQSVKITKGQFIAAILLFAPSLAWFYVMNIQVYQYGPEVIDVINDWVFIGEALFMLSIVCSALIGSILSVRVKSKNFLTFWILLGTAVTPTFAIFDEPIFFLILSVIAGISFGIGFPSCLAFIANSTNVDERARVSGTILLITFFLLILMNAITSSLTLFQALLVLAIFRAVSLFAIKFSIQNNIEIKKYSWKKIVSTEGYGLYFLSWFIFMVGGSLSGFVREWLPDTAHSVALATQGLILTYLGVAFAALISGFFSDRYGRKRFITPVILISSLGFILIPFLTTATELNLPLFIIAVTSVLIALLGIITPLDAWAQDLLPVNERGKFLGILNIVQTVSQMIGATVGGIAATIYGIDWVFIFAPIFFLGSIPFFFFVKETLVFE